MKADSRNTHTRIRNMFRKSVTGLAKRFHLRLPPELEE